MSQHQPSSQSDTVKFTTFAATAWSRRTSQLSPAGLQEPKGREQSVHFRRKGFGSALLFICPHPPHGRASPWRATFPLGRVICLHVCQVSVPLYKCAHNTKRLELSGPQGEGMRETIPAAQLSWPPLFGFYIMQSYLTPLLFCFSCLLVRKEDFCLFVCKNVIFILKGNG